MNLSLMFFLESLLLGVGLAMDAFSVSLANGLNEQGMKRSKMFGISAVFAFFQGLMPLLGWICVHTVVEYFESFALFIPWIALGLLGMIGGKMLYDGIKNNEEEVAQGVGIAALLIQGVATSIDALSVGFTIADYKFPEALLSVGIIAAITFAICLAGIYLGKKFGTKLAGKATVFGGIILIAIGIEIFITGIL